MFERRGEQLVRCLAAGLAAQPAKGRGPIQTGPALQCVAQARRVLGDVGVKGRDQRDRAETQFVTMPVAGVGDIFTRSIVPR